MVIRVALFTGNYNYALDGVALTMNRLVAFLEREGVPVRVFAPTKPPAVLRHAGDLVSVPSIPLLRTPYRLAVGLTPATRRDLRAFAPTIIHTATPDLLGVGALRWGRAHGLPIVTTYHTHFTSYLKFYRLGFLESLCWWAHRWYYSRCDQVFIAANSMADELRKHGVQANYTHAPFGVDPAQFHPGRRSHEWRRAHGIADDEVAICFVGRIVLEKGLDTFTATVNQLAADGVKFRTVVIGDGPAREQFQAELPNATFTGYLTGEALATAFASSDIFFFPSASETFGCVTVEALASGLAVVVADATGSRDIVRHGTDGLVCPPGDVAAFAGAMRRLIEHAPERAAFQAAGLARAQEFRWDAVLREMLGHYHRALDAQRAYRAR